MPSNIYSKIEKLLRNRIVFPLSLFLLYLILFPIFMLIHGELVGLKEVLLVTVYLFNLPYGLIYLFGKNIEPALESIILWSANIVFFGGTAIYLLKCNKMKVRTLIAAASAILVIFILSLKGCAMMWASKGYGF
jgi:hypothetical protein